MTSMISTPGKYRSRKDDWGNRLEIGDSSIEEEQTDIEISTELMEHTKPPRRISLAMGFLVGSDKHNKRRSSIAVPFISRKYSSSQKNKNGSEGNIAQDRIDEVFQSSSSHSESNLASMIKNPLEKKSVYDNNDKEKKMRRTSLQNKLERRRRKGGISSILDENGLDNVTRQKRNSWWNIFDKQRTRRASQDVGAISKSTDSLPTTYQRSKSRSVDHGLAAPYDLDALRSKVDDRLNRDDRKVPTISYAVGDRDSLRSIAARFDTTPSELTALNRLASSFVYPGQQLLVPDKSKLDESDATSDTSGDRSRKISSDDLPEEKDILDGLRPASPKPGHIERVSSQNQTQPVSDDDPIVQRFLKINVRHITDGQGVVGGVLLVTPNAVMFDPNVSDPLVIENGPESYGVIAPMEFIVNAAIFNDIAHMRVGGETTSTDKPEIYHPKAFSRCETHSPGKDSLLVKDETFPELGVGSVDVGDDQESVCSSNDRDEGDAFPKAFERDLVTPNSTLEGKDKLTDDEAVRKKLQSPYDPDSKVPKSLEDRRKSLLDHHWAIPSKDRSCNCDHSFSEDGSTSQDDQFENKQAPQKFDGVAVNADAGLVKQSCYDSGIDIRDTPLPSVPIIPNKKVYSDADIVLSKEWVPPLTIAPTHSTATITNAQEAQQLIQMQNLELGGRKKTHSVNFSVDDNEPQPVVTDKNVDNKRNKMLKRLSHPLAWVEGLTGDKSQEADSAPNTGDSNQSVFSKVFSSSPITLVSEFGGNLFLSKTPSEDSGGSPIPLTPHSASSHYSQDSGSGGGYGSSGGGGIGQAGRSSIGTLLQRSSESITANKSQKPQPKLDYRSMVSIDDMPTLFVSFDLKAPLFPQLDILELIPRPARACLDPPLYIRLRMGRQIGKSTPLPTTVMSYGKNKLRPEYWFSIPKNKVDELYRFLNSWVPQLYGELDEEAIKARGFELILNETQWDDKSGGSNKDGRCNSDGEITEYTRESWELLKAPFVSTYNKTYNIIKSQTGSNDLDGSEVLSMSTDDYRKAALFTTGSFDQEFQVPDLVGQTEILTEEHREKLCGHLPARAEGYNWSLVFSTSLHGFSLNSLYRKMQKLESPILIVIQDTENNVFGALTSCSLHVSDHFYGTGESLLYKFNPHFKVFHWSGENLYFIKGNPESLAIGAGDGRFGLWLDGDLNQGRSEHCSTYANEPLATQEDFVIKTLECWAFV